MLQDFMTKPLLTTSPQNNEKSQKPGGVVSCEKCEYASILHINGLLCVFVT